MTIAAFMQKIEQASTRMTPAHPEHGSFADCMKESTEIWSNGACAGYAISAAIAAGLDDQQTRRLIEALRAAFEEMTVDEAEKFYQNSGY
jgi:hypothetical protein